MYALATLIDYAVNIYIYILVANAILSWLVAFNVVSPQNNIVRQIGYFLWRVTEPVLAPIRRLLPDLDDRAEEMLAVALDRMPKNLRRRMLLTYLGFPFYDVATLPLLRNEGLTEFDPVKVDRISPDDARSIREGGTRATLRGIEFYNFGAFFSRAYRENDYLWGRLHGAERMIDLVCSTMEKPLSDEGCRRIKRKAFEAILDEEEAAGRCAQGLVDEIRGEVAERMS